MTPHQKALCSLKIVIAGGGVSGLAAAVALRRAGHDIIVLERNETLVKGSGSIRSQPNMTRILYQWGLERWLQQNAQVSREITTWDAVNNELLGSVLLHEELLKRLFLQNMLIMPYGALLTLLYDLACDEGVEFRFGTKLTGIVAVDELDDGSSGCIVLAGDSDIQCDVVVGADGPSSVVRSTLTGIPSNASPVTDLTLNFAVAVDEVADVDDLKPIIGSKDWHVYLGDRYRIGITTINHGRDLDISITYSLESHGAPDSLPELEDNKLYPIDLFRLDKRRFHPSIQKLLARNHLVRPFKYFTPPVIESLTSEKPRIILIGEAAHPQLPYGLHNAGFGIEDAQSLAILLSRLQCQEELPQLLSGFDDVRHNRCLLLQGTDRDKYKLFTLPFGPESEARNEKLKKAVMKREWENIDEACLPTLWRGEIELFAYDVTERVEDWWMKWGWLVRRTSMDLDDGQMNEEVSDKNVTPNLEVSVVSI